MIRRFSIIILFLTSINATKANDRHDYIETYAPIATMEMNRIGIPASIKLAQAILESNAGSSMLAVKANNHFGIKCGSTWKGKTFYRKDDDKNARGKLIKSCFRHFESARESFVAHSEFLRDPRKSYRYGFLFQLSQQDYKSWAKGLKSSGYATNPKYAKLLIKIIEDYQLYKYDLPSPRKAPNVIARETLEPSEMKEIVLAEKAEKKSKEVLTQPEKSSSPPKTSTIQNEKIKATAHAQIVKYNNGVEHVKSIEGDNARTLAKKYKISIYQLMRYNKGITDENQSLENDSYVYLRAKKKKYKGRQKYHVVRSGENLLNISNQYGVSVSALKKRNRMKGDDEPAIGEKIYLKGKNKKGIKIINKIDRSVTQHVIQKGETLYSIARAYGIQVDVLKKKNNLADNTIQIGQILFIP